MNVLRLLCLAFLVCAGCEAWQFDSGLHMRWPRYAVAFANDTDQKLHDVQAEWDVQGSPYVSTAGVLSTGAEKRNNEEVDPIPQKVVVSWKTADDKEHHQPVEVAPRIKDIASFNGTVWFKFTDAGVEMLTSGPDEPWIKLKHRS